MGSVENTTFSDNWLTARDAGPGVWAIDDRGQDTMYLIAGSERALLLDTGWGVGDLPRLVASLTGLPLLVANTHGHPDHVLGNGQFDTIYISEADAPMMQETLASAAEHHFGLHQLPRPLPAGFDPERWATAAPETVVPISDGHTFDLGGRVLEAIAVPGHSPGSLCFLDRTHRLLFTGDSLLAGTLWLHLENSTPLSTYHRSLLRLHSRAGEFDQLLPAHGPLPLPSQFVEDLIAAVEAVLAGRSVGVPEHTFAGDGLRYDFGASALLYRPENL